MCFYGISKAKRNAAYQSAIYEVKDSARQGIQLWSEQDLQRKSGCSNDIALETEGCIETSIITLSIFPIIFPIIF